MSDIAEIVNVNITVQDATPAVANFGTIAIFAGTAPGAAGSWVGAFNASPGGLAEMIAAGFSVNDAAYIKASAIVKQNPRTDKFKIYKRAAKNVHTQTLTVTKTTEGFKQTFEIGTGATLTPISYTNGAAETTTTIATALELLIEAVTGINSTSAADIITITTATVGDRIYVRNMVRQLTIDDTSADAGIATDLAAAVVDDGDFFGFVIDSTCHNEIAPAANWAEANKRMFFGLSTDSDIVAAGSSDIASALKSGGLHFSAVMFTRDPLGSGDASLMARQFSRDPGSSSYHMKNLPGVVVDNLTGTELSQARSKNALTYVNTKGISHTFDGKAASGRFLDITHGVEWLKARIAERVFAVLANAEKVDFTDSGIAQLESEVRAQLADAEARRFIAPGWTVTVPKASAVSPLDKAARLLPDLDFNAVLAGAIHKVVIDGTVRV